MQYNKIQKGRSMLEMLAVLAIVGILSVGGLAGFRMAMDHNKANKMLDYINHVFLTIKSHGDDDSGYKPSDSIYFDCEEIVPDMPAFIYKCGANRECAGDGASCITNVFAYFEDGERGAAAILESKLGLVVRDKRPNRNRVFQKSDCVDEKPISCSQGFAPCASVNQACSLASREFSSGNENSENYYTDADCEVYKNGYGCSSWDAPTD